MSAPGRDDGAVDFVLPWVDGADPAWRESRRRFLHEAGAEAKDLMKEQKELWKDKVLIITDVSQGIVPMDKTTRAFREMNGRLMLYLASEAEEVWRVFCGIGKRIK